MKTEEPGAQPARPPGPAVAVDTDDEALMRATPHQNPYVGMTGFEPATP